MQKQVKRRYVTTIVVTLATLMAMVTINFVSFYRNSVSQMLAVGHSSLKQEKELLNGYLIKGMDVLQVTAISVEYMMQNDESSKRIENFLQEESRRYMEDIDVNFTGVYGLFRGDYLDGSGWVPAADYVPKEREWYIAAVEAAGSPTIVSPYLDAKTNTIMISVSQLLYDGESVISLDIALEEVQILTQDIKLDGMGYGFVVDREGLVIAHSDEVEKGKNYRDNENMGTLMRQIEREENESFNMSIDGEDCTVFTDVIMDDWYIAMVISNTKLYHEIRQLIFQNIIVCLIVFVIILIFCTTMFRSMKWHMNQLEESKEINERLNDTIMRTLARTIDAKDRYTNGHSQRVAKYAVEIARRLGKSEEELKNIYYAGLLHDVGKIHIPDAIINKPAKLTSDEYSHIKLHPLSGYYILRDIKENPAIPQGAKWHHERYDGNGYPNGLVAKNIPEVARIIGVADAYDAMTSNRSYRQVMSQKDVRNEIVKGKGTQFDPEIAEIMLQMIDEDTNYSLRQTSTYKRILMVDDKSADIELVQEILKDEPQYILYAENTGKAALKLMEETKMDAVLLDVQAADMDGFEIFRRIRKYSEVPVVFLTENRDIVILEKINALGVEDYLTKPFMPEAFLEVLHSILEEKADM